jgi:hypothetical protein
LRVVDTHGNDVPHDGVTQGEIVARGQRGHGRLLQRPGSDRAGFTRRMVSYRRRRRSCIRMVTSKFATA